MFLTVCQLHRFRTVLSQRGMTRQYWPRSAKADQDTPRLLGLLCTSVHPLRRLFSLPPALSAKVKREELSFLLVQTISIQASAVGHLEPFARRGNSSHLVADFGFASQEVSSHLVADFWYLLKKKLHRSFSFILILLRVLGTRSGVSPSSAHKCSSQKKLQWNKEVFAHVFLLALAFKP